MLGVIGLVELRHVWRFQCLRIEFSPIDAGKPGVFHDLLCIALRAAQPSERVLLQQPRQQVLQVRAHARLQSEVLVLDVVVQFGPVL